MVTIGRAAELVGVSASTLRAWERRYGVGTPQRSNSGYRLYDRTAIRSLSLFKALVDDGWSLSSAAEEVRRRATGSPLVQASAQASRSAADDALVGVAERFDAAGLGPVLDRGFSTGSFEMVADQWLLPALSDVGLGWSTGRVSVAGEHLVSAGVARRLAAAYDAAGDNPSGPRVVIGMPPGSRHDLGLFSFAVAARRAGLATCWLGADVPIADWVVAAGVGPADGSVLAVPTEDDVVPAAETAAALRSEYPGALLAVGGAYQDRAPSYCLRLGHEVGPAATALLHLLAAGPSAAHSSTQETHS